MSSQPTQTEIHPTEIQTASIQVPANQIEAVPRFYRAEDGSLQPIPHGLMEARAAAIDAHSKLVESGTFAESRVYPDPKTAEEFNAFPFNPEYILAHDGWAKHRLTVEHAVEKRIREKLGVPAEWEPDEQKIRWHKEQLARLEKADAAPRCEHIYADGTRCRGPRLKNGHECYAHTRMKKTATRSLALMPVEDANAVVVNIMEIHRAMCDDEITERRAGLLLYGHQLALTALNKVSFKETDPREMVREESGDRIIGSSDQREEWRARLIGGSGDRIIESSDHRAIGGTEELEIEAEETELGDRTEEAATLESREGREDARAGEAQDESTSGDEGDGGTGMECSKSNNSGDEGDGTGGDRGSGDLVIG